MPLVAFPAVIVEGSECDIVDDRPWPSKNVVSEFFPFRPGEVPLAYSIPNAI